MIRENDLISKVFMVFLMPHPTSLSFVCRFSFLTLQNAVKKIPHLLLTVAVLWKSFDCGGSGQFGLFILAFTNNSSASLLPGRQRYKSQCKKSKIGWKETKQNVMVSRGKVKSCHMNRLFSYIYKCLAFYKRTFHSLLVFRMAQGL